MSWYYFKPRLTVGQRIQKSNREIAARQKKGETLQPVVIEGRNITQQFWGNAWCNNLKTYADAAYRLGRGRSYAINGSVIDLQIAGGKVTALVCGSSVYKVNLEIAKLPPATWVALKEKCAGQIGSLIELIKGQLSDAVMAQMINLNQGLFPKENEVKLQCSCPDYATMCKHVAAVLLGVGHRLDSSPELLFKLRGVDHLELIDAAIPASTAKPQRPEPEITATEIFDIFGIDVAATSTSPSGTAKPKVQPKAKPKAQPKAKPPVSPAKPSLKQAVKLAKAATVAPPKRLIASKVSKIDAKLATPVASSKATGTARPAKATLARKLSTATRAKAKSVK
jgi:uncharacterized Zn finger protein